ncbi:MAG: type II secretion system F family protein [Agathobacter sp.]|nr:type II secretion system F family protein [Agathobacter sp.]
MSKEKIVEPQYIFSPLNNYMINYKVYYMSLGEKVLSFLVTLIIGGAVGLVFYGDLFKVEGEPTTATHISNVVVFIGVGLLAAKIFIPAITAKLKEQRDKKLQKQFLDFLETLLVSLTAGNTVNDSFINAERDLQNQYSEGEMIVRELMEITTGLSNGKTLEEMLISFGDRSNNEDILNFSNVMSNCYRLGGDFKDVVRKTSDIINDKIAVAQEIETKISSNKLQLNAMTLMPIALVAMLKMSSPSFAENLSSFLGVLVTTVAIGIFVASYFWGQKIVDIR